MIKMLIFDFDFTLGDSTEGIFPSITYALENMGIEVPTKEFMKQSIGMNLPDSYKFLTGDTNTENGLEYKRLFREKAKSAIVPGTRLYDGYLEVLNDLQNKYNTTLLSTKAHYQLQGIADKFNLKFNCIVGGDDVSREKPDPEGILSVLDTYHLKGDEVLYFGDTMIDAKACERANVPFVALTTGTTSRETFIDHDIKHIYSSLMDAVKDLQL